jgi:hypothetical protein
MSCILDILSKEELIKRKENLLKELNKVDNEIKKRDNFTLHISDFDNTLLHSDLIINNETIYSYVDPDSSKFTCDQEFLQFAEESNMTFIESSNILNSSIDKYSHNSTEPNKKISKIKLKKTNNLQDNNELEVIKEQISCTESVPLFVEILKDNINPKLKIKGSIKINIKKI